MSERAIPAAEAAGEVALCVPCTEQQGLCVPCAVSVLPQLKRPSWHRDVHLGVNAHGEKQVPDSPEVAKQRRRVAKRDATRVGPKCYQKPAQSRLSKHARRFARALAGEHTRAPKRPTVPVAA